MPNIEDWAKPVLLTAALAFLGWIAAKILNAFKDTPERGRLRSELEQRKRDVRAANIGALWHELKAMRDWYHRNASELDKQEKNKTFYVQWLSKEWLSWSENPTTHDAWPADELEQLYRDIDKMKV